MAPSVVAIPFSPTAHPWHGAILHLASPALPLRHWPAQASLGPVGPVPL